jgi:hypothetical protein
VVDPSDVVIAIYIGNDFMDAYNIAYSNDYWAGYRSHENSDRIDSSIFLEKNEKPKFLGHIRDWLSRRSVLYRVVTQNVLFESLRQREKLSRFEDSFQVKHLGEQVLLAPGRVQPFVETEDSRMPEALSLVERALKEIVSLVREAGATPHIAIVPVKEAVYLPHAADQLSEEQRTEMDALVADLDKLTRHLQTFLETEGISYTDLGPVMTESLKTSQIYPLTDGHPNGRGYAMIAKALGGGLSKPAQ